MTSNIQQFNLALDDFIGQQVPKLAVLAHKKVTLDALRGVVKKSPVDTGRFRGNWQVSAGTENPSTTARLDKSAYGSEPGGDVLNGGLQILATLEPYSVTFIQNNLPYAQKLESGSSKQAPQGMVALTLAELQASFPQREGTAA